MLHALRIYTNGCLSPATAYEHSDAPQQGLISIEFDQTLPFLK